MAALTGAATTAGAPAAPTVIAVGSDHGGYDLKTSIIEFLEGKAAELNVSVVDAGYVTCHHDDQTSRAYGIGARR